MRPGSISIELKTLYGYESVLFGIIADARQGMHAQVDVRKYFVKGGHKPVDDALVHRVEKVLEAALKLQHWQRDLSRRLPQQLQTILQNSKIIGDKQEQHVAFSSQQYNSISSAVSTPETEIYFDFSSYGKEHSKFSPSLASPGSAATATVDHIGSSAIFHVNANAFPGDMVFGFGTKHSVLTHVSSIDSGGSNIAAIEDVSLQHLLGPFQHNQTKICHGMIFSKLREQLGQKDKKSFHCDICTTYVVRRLVDMPSP